MNRIVRSAVCALFASVALSAFAAAPASSPFNGTWHIELAKTKFSPKPLSFYIGHGWYHCITCNPTFTVPADGQNHAVAGQAYDSISVTIVDPHTITSTVSKNGKVIGEQTRTVSNDGKVLNVKGTEHSMDGDKTSTYAAVAKRSGIAPADVDATSGDWIIEKESGSENGLITVYKLDGDDLTMSAPTGQTYTAKLDGGDFPVKGAYGWDAVSLKKINAHSIEETDKRNGTVTDVSTMTVAGNTMTIVDSDKLNGRTSTYVAHKD